MRRYASFKPDSGHTDNIISIAISACKACRERHEGAAPAANWPHAFHSRSPPRSPFRSPIKPLRVSLFAVVLATAMSLGCGSAGVSVAGRCPACRAPGGRRAARGRRDVTAWALPRPQLHIAGVSGPRPGRGAADRGLTLTEPHPCGRCGPAGVRAAWRAACRPGWQPRGSPAASSVPAASPAPSPGRSRSRAAGAGTMSMELCRGPGHGDAPSTPVRKSPGRRRPGAHGVQGTSGTPGTRARRSLQRSRTHVTFAVVAEGRAAARSLALARRVRRVSSPGSGRTPGTGLGCQGGPFQESRTLTASRRSRGAGPVMAGDAPGATRPARRARAPARKARARRCVYVICGRAWFPRITVHDDGRPPTESCWRDRVGGGIGRGGGWGGASHSWVLEVNA
jgi:hypothetical protein